MEEFNILVCDDDHSIVDAIEIYLKQEGYRVIKAYNGLEALKALEENEIHLIILDIMMPQLDGLQATVKIREICNIPILMLSAKSEDTDKVLGLNFGADDYITKPFNPLEVVARVKTQLRRYIRYNQTAPEPAPAAVYDCGGLYIDHESHTCTLYSKPLSLTPLEFEILWYLCSRKGHVVSSEELFEAVWGEKYLDSNNTVMAHIARLREKMGELPRKPKWIKTVWGVGYKIDE